jgi:anti-sigma regulatory factor (Ser/Thr protein kinase)
MVTCRDQPQDRIHGLQVGANHYLTKPFTPDQLERAIQEVSAWKEELIRHGTRGEIHFHMKSDTQSLEELNFLLGALFLHSGMPQGLVKQLTMAVREMGTNAIESGHQKQIDRIVTVTYRIDSEKITIIVRDAGPGFNPNDLPHAAKPGDPIGHLEVREKMGLREGGFGIMIARGLVDELQYNEKGNEVRLVKFFPKPKVEDRG